MEYLLLKWLHILSATLMYGTGLGSAFYKFMTDRTGNLPAIAETNRLVVLADWLITTPTVILQPITGILIARAAGYPLTSDWIVVSLALYALAGACWLPVVVLQIRMRDLARETLNRGQILDARYARMTRLWVGLGIPAFAALIVVYYLMVFKPVLWS
jgi:uncharacterized membrane protein